MKIYKLIFLSGILFICNFCNSQEVEFEYGYDLSGNRISRRVLYFHSTRSTEADSIHLKSEPEENLFENIEVSLDNININLYPNPVKEILYIQIDGYDNFNQLSYQLLDINGKTIENNSFTNSFKEVNISHINPGSYILRIYTKSKQKEFKIIKQ